MGIDYLIARATGTDFNLVDSLKVNAALNVTTLGVGSTVAKLRHLGKVAALASHADEVADAARAVAEAASHADEAADAARIVGKGLGQWVQNAPHMSAEALDYQEFVTGVKKGFEFLRNGVHFDGLRVTEAGETVLLDAKYAGAGADSLYSKVGKLPFAAKEVREKALRQIAAAEGLRIEWHVSDRTAWQALKKFFKREGFGIDVIFTPWSP